MPELMVRGRHHRRTIVRTCVVALLAAVAVPALLAAPASAHDELLSTTPTGGSTVATVPAEVVLRFAEPPLTLGMAVQVVSEDGKDRSAGAPLVSASTVTQSVQAGAPAGRYTVHWRVTADDGHPVSGTFGFDATAAGGSSDTAGATQPAAGAVPTGAQSPSGLWWVGAALLAAAAIGAVVGLGRRRTVAVGADSARGSDDD